MFDFQNKPGLLFVWATLLPLAAFTLLLVLGGIRNFLRPYRNQEPWAAAFHVLDTVVTARGGFFIGFAGIVLAFLCSFSGFCWYLGEIQPVNELRDKIKTHEHAHKDGEGGHHEAHDSEKKLAEAEEELESRWSDHFIWAAINPRGLYDDQHGTRLTVGYRIDSLSAVMFVMVTFVASLIFLFSSGYMAEELQPMVEDHEVHTDHGHFARRGRFGRFFLFLSLFCFSMLNLLLADNLFQIFVSWELVGVCSYLLIGFYYERTSASNAANKAFITNRVGDAGFIIGLLILWTYVGTLNFQEIFDRIRCHDPISHATNDEFDHMIVAGDYDAATGEFRTAAPREAGDYVLLMPREPAKHFHLPKGKDANGDYYIARAREHPLSNQFGVMPYWLLVVAGLGIFLGCVGKSAQFPLQVWLPDAMEGPTPVSALIHAATMVAAGVYLVGRTYPLFTPEVLLTIAYIGGITLFVAASIAIVMTDIKKVLAYSTVSQLGYMMLGLGVGGWAAGLFHLLTHAFFKALLFLGSGSVIAGCHHVQDMGRMGGLFDKMKITGTTMLIGVFAIAGFPLFSGWYSKDAVLAHAFGFAWVNKQHMLLFLLPLVTAGITTFYMFRMWFMTFAGKPRDHHVYEHAHETPWPMTAPLVILAALSICVAWGWPVWDAKESALLELLTYSQPDSVEADFGKEPHGHGAAPMEHVDEAEAAELERPTAQAHRLHDLAGALAIILVILGTAFALGTYYYRILDPADSVQQFLPLHRFLSHKWYFDELYSAIIVKPGIMFSRWAATFDRVVIDGFVNLVGKLGVLGSKISGWFDKGVVDGLVNLMANVWYGIGTGLRGVQTGYLRSYVLFLALAAMGLFVLLTAYVSALSRAAQ
jgi:NADH-quinone oxidoreductase subunit L